MLTGEALEIVLNMAKERASLHNLAVTTTEIEAIEEIEFLFRQYLLNHQLPEQNSGWFSGNCTYRQLNLSRPK